MQTELILIRHGETDWNVQGRIQGHTDIPLNARGHDQAQRAAGAVAALHLESPVSAVISSDMQRALQTAAPIASACNVKVQSDALLREKGYGVLEGLTWNERNAKYPELDYEHELANPQFTVPQGESRQAFFDRVIKALQLHAAKHEGQCIVIVTHGGVLDMAYRAALQYPLTLKRNWPLGNAALNSVWCSMGALKLRYWSEEYHL